LWPVVLVLPWRFRVLRGRVGCGGGGWCGWWPVLGTLLGPEGTTVHASVGLGFRSRRGLAANCLRWAHPGGCGGRGWVSLRGRGLVVCCELHSGREHLCGQVVKGERWMPWHQEPMKDVGGRDRPGGAVNRAVIPGCPNGVTRHQLCGVTRT
jgi:hypothetical protein